MRLNLNTATSRAEALGGKLGALSPLSILERGYSLVFDSEGQLIKDAAMVSPGEEIRAKLARGEIAAVIKASE